MQTDPKTPFRRSQIPAVIVDAIGVVLSLWEGNATARFHQSYCWCGNRLAARGTGFSPDPCWLSRADRFARFVAGAKSSLAYRYAGNGVTGPQASRYRGVPPGPKSTGYVEGQNLKIEYQSAEGHPERFPALAQELVSQKVDVITTRGTPAAFAARNATATIPIVMTAIGDPLLAVSTLAHPGGNITGLSAFVTDLMAKRVEILRDLVPGITSVGALLSMSNGSVPAQWDDIKQSAQNFGMQAQLFDVRKTADLSAAFGVASQQHIGAFIVEIDALTQANNDFIAELAAKHRLPAIYPSREFVDAGGLVTYGVNYPDLYRRAATFVDKILKGAKPADLPVEQPTTFELVLNLKAAKALGLNVSREFQLRADEVIE